MRNSPRLALALCFGLALPVAAASQTVRGVRVLDSKNSVEIEIEASSRMVPETRVLTTPDRLVLDFPNAVPASDLRTLPVNRGEVKDVRIGLFKSNPPVTRVVFDLKSPQPFQVFPYGHTVIIKVGTPQANVAAISAPRGDPQNGVENFPAESGPGLINASYSPAAVPVQNQPAPAPALQVTFQNGLLAIRANKANLSEVLAAVRQSTGADISIAPGAGQEPVVADIAPAPAPQVLARLLNGSKFNFLILSSPRDPRVLARVILTARTEAGPTPLPPVAASDTPKQEPPRPPAAPVASAPPQPDLPGSQPEMQAPPADNAQD